MRSSCESSMAGYSTSSTTGLRRWISSTNSTSRGSRLVSSAARSPGRSSTGPGGLAQIDLQLIGDDVRQRGLAEPGRPEDQHMIQGLAALARRLDEDVHLGLHVRLPHVVGEAFSAARRDRRTSSSRPAGAGNDAILFNTHAVHHALAADLSARRMISVVDKARVVDRLQQPHHFRRLVAQARSAR